MLSSVKNSYDRDVNVTSLNEGQRASERCKSRTLRFSRGCCDQMNSGHRSATWANVSPPSIGKNKDLKSESDDSRPIDVKIPPSSDTKETCPVIIPSRPYALFLIARLKYKYILLRQLKKQLQPVVFHTFIFR